MGFNNNTNFGILVQMQQAPLIEKEYFNQIGNHCNIQYCAYSCDAYFPFPYTTEVFIGITSVRNP
ncbi:hypothetical protein BH09BAC1_BH09BAC1_09180 [soil metagenome]